MSRRLLHRLTACALAALAGLAAAAGIALVTGHIAIVTTHGVSMNPVYYQGDLVIVARAPSYSAGQIAAYNLPGKDEIALHRIVGGSSEAFVFKGDNNQSIDALTPGFDQLVGRAVLHIPQGGMWLERLTSPPALGLAAFALMAGGSTTTIRRKRKRKQRKASMSRHTMERTTHFHAVSNLPQSLRTFAAITIVLGILGTVLGVLAWTTPLEGTSMADVRSGTRMDFSYSANVGKTLAYDGTTAQSPDPVFRKLTDTVDVQFVYHGEPGSMTVAAELTTPEGWHSTVPLADAKAFSADQYEGAVTLDLKAYEAKAKAASAVTGIPASQIAIKVIPQVKTISGADFRPELKLSLTPLQLALVNGEKDLNVTGTHRVQHAAAVPRTVGINGWVITTATARVISAVLLVTALAGGAATVVFSRRTLPADEGTAIRRRYAAYLVSVQPMQLPQGRPVIEVTTFPVLAKLAERYGLLILHWGRSGAETFVVHDESTTYQYQTGSNPPEPTASAARMGSDA
jgi:signal peptidase I